MISSTSGAAPSVWKGLWRITPKRSGAVVAVLYVTAALLEGVSVGLVLPFLSLIADSGAAPSHRVLARVIDAFAWAGIPFTLGPLLGIIGIAVLLRTVVQFGGSVLLVRVIERLLVRLRVKLVDNLFRVAPRYHTGTQAGELAQAVLDDIEKTGLAIGLVFKLLSGVALIVVWGLVLVVFSWQLTLLSTVVAVVVALLVRMRIRYSSRLGYQIAESKRRLSSTIVELLSGLRVIWLSTTETRELERVRAESSRLAENTHQFARNSAVVNAIGENFGSLALLGIVYFSVQRLNVGMATLVAFFFALSRVLPMSHRLNVLRTELSGYVAHAANVLQLLSREDKPYITDGTKNISAVTDDLELDHVWFEHRRGEPVLKGVSMILRRGETIALAGASGAGKSTVADLIARFADPTRGEIRVDGCPLRDLRIASWRARLGIVSQDVFLFNATIRENIAYGAAALDLDTVEQAARLANAHLFIAELPKGYDTVVGERGLTLSGGQRQRIALARAIARRPDVLILDEATSALDAESERLIFDAIEKLAGRVAILVIGHRLASLRKADRIYVLEAGEIVEVGTHAELLQSGGRYARYCQLQQV